MLQFIKRLLGSSSQSLTPLLEKGAVVVDVRTKEEFCQGHVKGARNIPLAEIKRKTDTIRSWGKPVITVCRSGNRSGAAKRILQAGNIECYNGGSWRTFNARYAG